MSCTVDWQTRTPTRRSSSAQMAASVMSDLAATIAPEHRLVRLQQGLAIAPDPVRRHAPRLLHAAHQLDRRRVAHRETLRRLPPRAASLDSCNDPLSQIS